MANVACRTLPYVKKSIRQSKIDNRKSLVRIYLTGFMASGKSTVGPHVAERLGYPFIDLDERIERRAGQSIPELFAAGGEAAFRAEESAALRATADQENAVVALGGGALVDDANRAWALRHGCVVYLHVSADTILERVADQADHRPLLQDDAGVPLSPEAMRARIEQMLRKRRPLYEDAHVTVDASQPSEAVSEAVVEAVRRQD